MPTYKLTISYDGTHYEGWQRQDVPVSSRKRPRTIQDQIETALKKLTGERVTVTGSGRTDSGVHAVGQVAHVTLGRPVALSLLRNALNGLLPPDIAVRRVEAQSNHFHARYDAAEKTYRYLLLSSPKKNPFKSPWLTQVKYPLDVSRMRRAARYIVGRKDFQAFQTRDKVRRDCIREIRSVRIKKAEISQVPFFHGEGVIVIDITATGFLRAMVRTIVGTLIDVGRGRIKPEQMKEILAGKNRSAAGPCAPADGLYLMKVRYA